MAEIKAALFTIDNTLVDTATGAMYAGLEELLRPDCRPFAMTHITARTSVSYPQMIRDYPAITPSSGMPVGLEYGTKIVVADNYADARTYSVLSRQGLTAAEQAAVTALAAEASCPVRVTFAPRHPAQKRIVWESAYQTSAGLQDLLAEHEPGFVTCYLDKIGPATDRKKIAGLEAYSYECGGSTTVDLIASAADKRHAALAIMNLCGLRAPETLISGDCPADFGMLSIAGVHAVLVTRGTGQAAALPNVTQVMPDTYAAYLRNLY